MTSDDRLRELEEKYEGYRVYDSSGEKIGKVDDLFVDEQDREEYIGVKMGFFGTKSTLIPMDVARVNERDRVIEVAESKQHVKDAPTFDDDEDITPDFEERIRSHFGLSNPEGSSSRGSYGGRSSATTERDSEGGLARDTDDERELDVEGSPAGASSGSSSRDRGDTYEESRERAGREEDSDREVFRGSGTTDTAASGAPSDLETGDRDRGSSEAHDPYREGYEEGLREAGREAARREVQSGSSGAGQGGETREATSDRSGSSEHVERERYGDEREREGGRSESTTTKVWRRLRS